MRLLFDQNLSFKLCQQLADVFPGSSQARIVALAEADDRTVWQYAGANGLVLVSQDADFAEMAALLGPPPKVIWLRAGNQPTSAIAALLRSRADLIAAFVSDETGLLPRALLTRATRRDACCGGYRPRASTP